MQYHLDTIPVWAAMEQAYPCPLCGLELKTEREEISRTLGAGVMEPSVRVDFNARGVCAKHQRMLYAGQNRLGHALLMDSHVKEQMRVLQSARRRLDVSGAGFRGCFGGAGSVRAARRALHALGSRCVVCEAVETHMARYRRTFLYLWLHDEHFRAAWQQSQGVCLPHAEALLASAPEVLRPARQRVFASEALALLSQRLSDDELDLDWFTRKFDYRHQAESWGESKTALERVVNRLRGWCLGDAPCETKNL